MINYWTENENTQFLIMVKNGKTDAEISTALGNRTVAAVTVRRCRLGTSRPHAPVFQRITTTNNSHKDFSR